MSGALRERGLFATAGLAACVALAGCQSAASPPAPSSSPDCLYGTASELEACANYDDEPEQCRIAGGIYDAGTQRCLM
jgi:hypothetical protein